MATFDLRLIPVAMLLLLMPMATLDLREERIRAGVSQLKLSILAHVSRWKIRLHELGATQLNSDELRRVTIVLRHETRAEAAEERAVAETLREYEKQVARSAAQQREAERLCDK